jgi:hypothetical protein
MRPAILALAASLAVPLPAAAWQDGFFHTRPAEPGPEAPLALSAVLIGPRAWAEAEGPDLPPFRDAGAELPLPGRLLVAASAEWREDRERGEARFSALQGAISLALGGEALRAGLRVEYEERDPALEYAVDVADWDLAGGAVDEGPGRRRALKTRLALACEPASLDLALNVMAETDLALGTTRLGFSAGALWAVLSGSAPEGGGKAALAVGLEAHGLLGDLSAPALSGPDAALHLGPVVLLRPAVGLAVRAQLAADLARPGASGVRLVVAREI